MNSIDSKGKTTELITFFSNHSSNKECPKLVDQLLNYLSPLHLNSDLRIKKIANEMELTSKHLISQFRDIVGITPKKFFQIGQINLASKMMWANPNKKLTSIALECGFYDQSHFIRTFKKITNTKPLEFRHQQINSQLPYPGTILI